MNNKDETDVFLPVKRVTFVYNNFKKKPIQEIPAGYRHFYNSVDDNFFGGVLVFSRKAFIEINGACPLYVGWGCEDADLYNRVVINKLRMARSMDNMFYALDHNDNGKTFDDEDFVKNTYLVSHSHLYLSEGLSTQQGMGDLVTSEHPLVDKWIKIQNFK
jgi:hypothetical protein